MKNLRKLKPPIFLESFLMRISDFDRKFAVAADFEEIYRKISGEKGIIYALFWYVFQILRSLPVFIINYIHWRGIMLRNYMKIALRNIIRQKGFSFINIVGLAVGMTCCILILLWIQDEMSYDRFHENADTLYRVTEHQYNSSGDYFPVTVTPWPLAEGLKEEYPEIIESARLRRLTGRLMTYQDKRFYESEILAVDPSFLKMFSFPLIEGDPVTSLNDPNAVLVTETTAKRYFGDEDPIGKTIVYNTWNNLKVGGILKDPPRNSFIKFDFMIQFESIIKKEGWAQTWWTNNYQTFVQLQKGTSHEAISDKVYEYLKKHNERTGTMLIMQPVLDIHLHSDYAIDIYGATETTALYVYVFSIIAVFVLLIACINFMNLSTARSIKRAKEVGMRKVVGARKINVITQFYGESIILTIISMCVAIVLVYLFLPVFNDISGKALSFELMKNPLLFIGLFIIALITGLFSGSYPALIQSSFKPVDSIKGSAMTSSRRSGRSIFRQVLVITQFSLSIILIIGTLIVYKQLNFMTEKDLGYEKGQIVYFRNRSNIRTQFEAFKQELLKNSNITAVTASSDIPTYTVHSTSAFRWEGKDPDVSFLIHQFTVDFDYISTFNMKIKEGRDFSKEFTTDGATQSFILNETAIERMGLDDPVGKSFILWNIEGMVVGIVEDFHFKSLHKEIEPLCLRIDPGRNSYVFIKIKPDNLSSTLHSIEKIYNSFNQEYPLVYDFLDEAVDRLYNSDKRTGTIFNYFTYIAIVISCLGLFGLAAFMAQQKTKEIGIRKTLGATVSGIIILISKEFIYLVLVSNLIAWPVSWIVMNRWLENYASRINIDLWIFILSGLLATAIAIVTVSFQSIKAAHTDPTNSLRYE